jgi:DNA polymerase III alpha subunit (gram-positive type)
MYKGEAFELVRPRTNEERIKCLGLTHNAKWTWDENAKLLYLSGDVPLNLLISHREDVFEYMIEHGIEKSLAYNIAEYVRKGKALKNGWETGMLEIMQRAKIPLWYLESCSKNTYLFPRAHDMAFLKKYG